MSGASGKVPAAILVCFEVLDGGTKWCRIGKFSAMTLANAAVTALKALA